MDYKSVIEEQIRELQKAQDKVVKSEDLNLFAKVTEIRNNALTITTLCNEARNY